jgi:arabinose-5-phosphate isomerase
MNFIESAKRSFQNQISALQELVNSLDSQNAHSAHESDLAFNAACKLLMACKGKVVVCGMGKSGHIANKIAATLASTGTPAFFMHPAEANHGDFGMLGKDDVLMGISNSGETAELVGLLPSIKRIGVPIIAITNKPQSSLAKAAQITLDLKVKEEACSLGLAPTTSTTATLVLGDAIAVALLEAKGFTAEDFAFSHPGGALGKRLLLTVEDIMLSGLEVPKVTADASVTSALFEISSKGLGVTAVVDNNDTLLGIFSDGDLRRALDKRIDIHQTTVAEVMTKGGIGTHAHELAVDALNLMQANKINALFVLNENKQPIGALNTYMLLKAGVV